MAKKQSPSTLLWFIRRKAYIPLCEIRRRFDIDADDGSFFNGEDGTRIYAGLPAHTSAAIEKLWHQGKIGLELSVEFDCRVLIGVYPMVPVREPADGNGHHPHAPDSRRRPQIVHIPAAVSSDPPETASAVATGE
ncbi:MAG TPA: hypothetical protein VFB34_11935 [Chloroflexota bacterium]|nr:hypothetical protein [Chloroflexota bacterium]